MIVKIKKPKPAPIEPVELPPPRRHRLDVIDRKFDKTQLRAAQYGDKVHRDYAAHFFRWGFATRFIKKGMSVLDVGCGQDLPLVRVLAPSMSHIPGRYVGVDMNRVKPFKCKWVEVLQEFDFTSRADEIDGQFDVIVNFEVIEHMKKDDGRKLLEAFREKLRKDGVLLLSTPVYNEKHMAKNHVHEYRWVELKQMIEAAGLAVRSAHGTFMTSQAMKRVMSAAERALVDELHEFYSWDVLANFLAPKYPEAASNCCWVITKGKA